MSSHFSTFNPNVVEHKILRSSLKRVDKRRGSTVRKATESSTQDDLTNEDMFGHDTESIQETDEIDSAVTELVNYLKKNSLLGSGLPIDNIISSIKSRRGQAVFRNKLLKIFVEGCLVTEMSDVSILEAAHIDPFEKTKNNDVWNGIILRPDIHTCFDLCLVAMIPDEFGRQATIWFHKSIRSHRDYIQHHGNPKNLPEIQEAHIVLRKEALERHWKRCCATRNETDYCENTVAERIEPSNE